VTVSSPAGPIQIIGLPPGPWPVFRIEPPPPIPVPPPGNTLTFYIDRTGPGAITVPFTVMDSCGAWPTFVGGGPTAF
jgi:hypothetical protein